MTENYSLTVKNTLSHPKKIYYMVGNGSGMYYEYSITGTDSAGNVVNINNRNLRCVLPWSETDENGKARCVFYEMFSFDIGAGEERKINGSIPKNRLSRLCFRDIIVLHKRERRKCNEKDIFNYADNDFNIKYNNSFRI